MARGHARIKTTIWKDETFTARTPEAQRVYFMLLSQPGLSFCGVIDYTGRRWAALAKGTTAKTIAKAVEELADAKFVVLDEDHEELWVRSFVRHDGVLSGGPKLLSAMWKDFAAIASPLIRERFLAALPPEIREGAPDGVSDTPSDGASDTPSDTDPPEDAMPHPMPRGGARPLPSSHHPQPPSPATDPGHQPNPSAGLAVCEPSTPASPDRPPQAVVQVFEAWLASTGRTNQTLLDAKRRRLIDRALKSYPLADVLDAVHGWRRSPHHRGENPTSTVYNDLELLLRDAGHIEKFRDFERHAPSTNGGPRATPGEQAIDRVFAQLPRGAA